MSLCGSNRGQTSFFPFLLHHPEPVKPGGVLVIIGPAAGTETESRTAPKEGSRAEEKRRSHVQEKAERVRKNKIADQPPPRPSFSSVLSLLQTQGDPSRCHPRGVLSVGAKSLPRVGKGKGDTDASVPEWEPWSVV